jgi:hypothetical protein
MIRSVISAVTMLLIAGSGAHAEPAKAEKPAVTRAAVAAGMKRADCSRSLKDAMEGINVMADLAPKLRLVEVPCWSAAYQAGSIVFVVDPAAPAKARLLRFQAWDGKKLTSTFSLTLPDFDAEKKTLRSFHKGRGLGDCGTIGEWTWAGSDFKLTGTWIKDPCDGEPFDDDEAAAEKWRVYPPKR